MNKTCDILPPPRFLRKGTDALVLSGRLTIHIDPPADTKTLRKFIQQQLSDECGLAITFTNQSRCNTAHTPLLTLVIHEDHPLAATGHQHPIGMNNTDRQALSHSYGQGYIIRVNAQANRVNIIGAGAQGLRYGIITLHQLLHTHKSARWSIQDTLIRDYPAFQYRSLDWLINAEANRWCYDWGDGPAAFMERVKRALDRMEVLKLNMVQFDGFGWDTRKFPGYAHMMRTFNTYARERGIKLVFGGYGGGYGATYQLQFQRQGKLWGRVFKNRRSYPSGKTYACIGSSKDYPPAITEQSRTLGTCLSNRALCQLKIREIVDFVQRVEPGALYIHEMDSGSYDKTTLSWRMRCPQCRANWPNDIIEAPDGAAGAYAAWFRQVRHAVSNVRNPSGYHGADCVLLFTGPLYTSRLENDRKWQRECAYFKQLSVGIPPGENTMFVIREQTAPAGKTHRTEQLARLLAVNGHGCSVHCYADADACTNDHIFTPLPATARWFRGARALNFAHGHVFQDALQALDAVYLWNTDAFGALPPPATSDQLPLNAFRQHYQTSSYSEIYGGWLKIICRWLYGTKAEPHMSKLNSLMSPHGYGPSPIVWYPFTRRLWNGENLFDVQFQREWRERLKINIRAQTCIEAAWPHISDTYIRQDLQWMQDCLRITTRMLELLTKYSSQRARTVMHREFKADIRQLTGLIQQTSKREFTDPLGGEPGTWLPAMEMLKHCFGREARDDAINSDQLYDI